MATTLYFVQSDTLPQIKLTLTDEVTELPKDLTSKTVVLHCKPATGTGIKFSREATYSNGTDRVNGIAYIQWLAGDLNRPAGNYLAEVEIFDTATSSRETVYDLINITIREDIADVQAQLVVLPSTTPSTEGPSPT